MWIHENKDARKIFLFENHPSLGVFRDFENETFLYWLRKKESPDQFKERLSDPRQDDL
jgi:hypothetical protein